MRKLLCRLLGHRNDISCMDKSWRYTHDKCSRCGAKLPIAYPYHKDYARGQDPMPLFDDWNKDWTK